MGRANKKKRRRSPRGEQPVRAKGMRVSIRSPVLVAAVILAALGVGWYGTRVFRSPEQPSPASLPPEPPSIDVPEVLGVSSTPPEIVEEIRGEVQAVCEMLRRDLPDRPEAHSLIALTQYRYGLKDEALKAWQRAKELDEDFSPAHVGLGLVAADEGRDREAIAAFRRAIELNPSTEEAYAKLVEVLLRQNEVNEALAAGQEFVRRFPESRKATYWLGQSYLQSEQYEEAVVAHRTVIRQHADLTPSYYSLAVALARLGRRDEAAEARAKFAEMKKKDLQKGRDLNRNYVDIEQQKRVLAKTHLSAGNVYFCAHHERKAEAHWLRGVEVCGEELACRQALAAFYQSRERWRSLDSVASELVGLCPDDPDAWHQLAVARGHCGEFDEAEESYRREIELAPENAPAYLGLLRFSLEVNRELPDAVALARKAVELAPSPDSYLILSTVLESSGERTEALAAVEEAMRLAPGHPQLQQVYRELQQSM